MLRILFLMIFGSVAGTAFGLGYHLFGSLVVLVVIFYLLLLQLNYNKSIKHDR